MKKSGIWILMLLCTWKSMQAQAPNLLNYQAVIRNASGSVLANQAVRMRVTLLRGSAGDTVVYQETHRDTTNSSGLVQMEIGAGAMVSGSFAAINWAQGPYYIRTETDPTGGTNYQIVGSTQLLSVPFSLFTQSASLRYSATGDTLFSGSQYVIVPGLSATNQASSGQGTASLTTTVATIIAETSATIGGLISNQGAAAVTTRGIVYAMTGSPTTSNFTVIAGSGTGSFQANLTQLNGGTPYYARAFATNTFGTSYGNQVVFTTTGSNGANCTGKIKDIDSNEYNIVQIGNQCWMKENLRVTKFRNGVQIPLDNSGGVNGNAPGQTWARLGTPARTIYNQDQNNLPLLGFLYNKFTVLDARGVCPVGWHVPNPSEWISLANTLGGELLAGGKMKITGTDIWRTPNEGADNSSGFSAYPSGIRQQTDGEGKFVGKGEIAFYWSTSGGFDFGRELQYDNRILKIPTTITYGGHEPSGGSIRCVRD